VKAYIEQHKRVRHNAIGHQGVALRGAPGKPSSSQPLSWASGLVSRSFTYLPPQTDSEQGDAHKDRPLLVSTGTRLRITTQGLASRSFTTQGLVSRSFTTQGLVSRSFTTQGLASRSFTTQGLVSRSFTTQGLVSRSFTTQDSSARSFTTQGLVSRSFTICPHA